MANNILNTAEIIDKINVAWKEHVSLLSQSSAKMQEFNNSAKLPSSYVQSVNGLKGVYDSADKSLASLTKAQKQYEAQAKAEIRVRNNRVKAMDKYEKQLVREQKALERNTGLYNKVSQRVKALTLEYNQLATKKALGMKLDRAELSSLKQITLQLTKYDAVLKKVDADVGKHQRNVGNYKSAYDGLGWSVAQLAREAPAFANSIQTGFMAISNNLPMLFDEIGKTKREVASLRAQGIQTGGVFSKLAKSIFSFQTLLSVGVTLLTIYGKDIVEWAGGLFSGSKALNAITENTKKLNEESRNIAGQSIPKFQALVNIITDVTTSEEKRKDAMIELKKEYPDFNAQILDEKDNTKLVNDEVGIYIKQIEKKAKAQASMSMLQEKYNKLILAEQNTEKERQKLLSKAQTIDPSIQNADEAIKFFKERKKEADQYIVTTMYGTTTQNSRQDSLNKLNGTMEEESAIQQEINALMDVYVENVDFAIQKEDTQNKLRNSAKKETEKYVDVKRGELDFIKSLLKYYENLREPLHKSTQEYKDLTDQIDALNNVVKASDFTLDANYQKKVRDAEASEEQRKALLKLKQATDSFIEGISLSSLGNLGMGSLTTFFDGTFDNLMKGADTLEEKFAVTFNAIAEVAKEAFAIIDSVGKENFNNQYSRLEKQKEVAIMFSNGTVEAEAEINRQYEEQRKQIQKREAEANKKMAIFNIVTSTAQGIVGALASTPPNVPLSIAIGVIGAVQAGIVQGTQIPEFKDGVRGFDGGLAIVGDGGKHEYIRTPDGKVSKTPNTDTLVNLPKGTDVFSDENDFMNSLYSELNKNNINPFSSMFNANIVPNMNQGSIDSDKIINALSKDLKTLNNTVKNKTETSLNIDERGVSIYNYRNGQKREVLNARVRGKSRR